VASINHAPWKFEQTALDKELKKSVEFASELEERDERITSLVSDLDGARVAQDEMRKGNCRIVTEHDAHKPGLLIYNHQTLIVCNGRILAVAEAQRINGELARAQSGWDAKAEEYDTRIATLQVCGVVILNRKRKLPGTREEQKDTHCG
jgi:hypothetical protein